MMGMNAGSVRRLASQAFEDPRISIAVLNNSVTYVISESLIAEWSRASAQRLRKSRQLSQAALDGLTIAAIIHNANDRDVEEMLTSLGDRLCLVNGRGAGQALRNEIQASLQSGPRRQVPNSSFGVGAAMADSLNAMDGRELSKTLKVIAENLHLSGGQTECVAGNLRDLLEQNLHRTLESNRAAGNARSKAQACIATQSD